MNAAIRMPRDNRRLFHYASLAILLISVATGLCYAIYLQQQRNAAVERTREAFAALQDRRDYWIALEFRYAIARQQRARVPHSEQDLRAYHEFLVGELPKASQPSLVAEYFQALALLGDNSSCGEMQRTVDRLRELLGKGTIDQSDGPSGSMLEVCEAAMRALECPDPARRE